ncbi:MAG: matrixin family metalloprotease [Planctomycetota bacterium]
MRQVFRTTLWIGVAAGLIAALHTPRASAFTLNGNALSVADRHFRVFNNFADFEANNATLPSSQFPGFSGAITAIWKGFVEWGSAFHGTGGGDPTGQIIGSGFAGFDWSFQGRATGPGVAGDNVVSAISSCSGGVVAFTENQSSGGWRIRFCDQVVWEDGPSLPSTGNYDIQGIATHHAGHALGLGHSSASTVMRPVVGFGGSLRNLTSDDRGGLIAIYGGIPASKPVVSGVTLDLLNNKVTITGSNFDATSNEIWFTNVAATAPSVDPTVRSVALPSTSNGTMLVADVPANAGPGDLLVKIPGSSYSTLSNAYPAFIQYTPSSPSITAVLPTSIPALVPGTSPQVLLVGSAFTTNTQVWVEGIQASSLLLASTQLAFDMPQVPFLGTATIEVREGSNADTATIEIVPVTLPRLQLGTGEAANPIQIGIDPLRVVVAAPVGHLVYAVHSRSNLPSVWPGVVSLDIGNSFQEIPFLGLVQVGAAGWEEVWLPPIAGGTPGSIIYAQGVDLSALSAPLPKTNLQGIQLQ